MKPQVLLFDLDQTLLASRSRRLQYQFILRATRQLRKNGLSFSKSIQLLDRMKKTLRAGDKTQTNADRVYDLFRLSFPKMGPAEAKIWVDSWIKEVFQGLLYLFSPVTEGERLFQDLRASGKYRLVLATNPAWPLAVTRLRLELGSLRVEQFEWVTHAENMHFTKPDLRYYEEMVQFLKISPAEALMIGDSFRKDAVAVELGMPVFIVHQKPKIISPLLAQGSFSDLRQRLLEP